MIIVALFCLLYGTITGTLSAEQSTQQITTHASSTTPVQFAIHGDIIHADTLSLLGFECIDLSAVPSMDDGVVTLTQLRATLYGGTITGTASYDVNTDTFSCSVELQKISLNQLIRRYIESEDDTKGTLSGFVSLTIPHGELTLATGSGSVFMENGSLIYLPAVTAFLLGETHPIRGLDRGKILFTFHDNLVEFTKIRLYNPSVKVKGHGSISFDGNTNITLKPLSLGTGANNIPILGPLFKSWVTNLSRHLVRINIVGHISNLHIKTDTLTSDEK